MELYVVRDRITDKSACGMLDIDGVFKCYTLEPPLSGSIVAIPDGTYKVALLESPHFQIVTPHILDVPGRTEIEIHPGNYPSDTHGCTLVGTTRGVDCVLNSRQAFDALMIKLHSATAPITITYETEGEVV